MAAGIPVIASDITCNRYIVRHEQTGLLFSPSYVGALAITLERITDTQVAMRAKTAHDLIHNHFSANQCKGNGVCLCRIVSTDYCKCMITPNSRQNRSMRISLHC